MRKWNILVTALHMTQRLMIAGRWQGRWRYLSFLPCQAAITTAWLLAIVILNKTSIAATSGGCTRISSMG